MTLSRRDVIAGAGLGLATVLAAPFGLIRTGPNHNTNSLNYNILNMAWESERYTVLIDVPSMKHRMNYLDELDRRRAMAVRLMSAPMAIGGGITELMMVAGGLRPSRHWTMRPYVDVWQHVDDCRVSKGERCTASSGTPEKPKHRGLASPSRLAARRVDDILSTL